MVHFKVLMKRKRKELAKKHIAELYRLQQENMISDPKQAQRYTDLIRKLSLTFKIKLDREIKRSFCKHCYAVFSANNSRTRLQKGKIVKYCNKCRNFTRIQYT